jgi:phosphatidylinositol glycan class V
VISAVLLYWISLRVGYGEESAFRTALFRCVSPISIFYFSAYTESIFAFFSFAGMLLWLCDHPLFACLYFTVAASVRSNGLFLAGFFCYSFFLTVCPLPKIGTGIYESLYRALMTPQRSRSFHYPVMAALCLVPSVGFAVFANRKFCPGPDWCGSSPYSSVQLRYWNVGFLRYWTLQQLPNLLLALPISGFVIGYLWRLRNSQNVQLIPFAVHLAVLLLVTLFWAHVEVTTRVLLAASPAAWWSLAASQSRFAVVFCVSYCVVGIALFVNFLPWT